MTCIRTKEDNYNDKENHRFFEILFEDCLNKTSSEITLGKGVMTIKVSLQTQTDQGDTHIAASAGQCITHQHGIRWV